MSDDFELTADPIEAAAEAYRTHGGIRAAARATGTPYTTMNRRVNRAANRGLLGTTPVMPGYEIKQVSGKDAQGNWVKQTKEHGEQYATPAGMAIKHRSVLVDAAGQVMMTWNKESKEAADLQLMMRAALDGFKDELPRASPVAVPLHYNPVKMLNQYTVTDLHMGMLAWAAETGSDYDLKIAERLLLDWFAAAIRIAPPARRAVFAQIGDLLHHDGFESKTPASGHILDADSRLQKVIRVVIRSLRKVIAMLLAKHDEVDVIMADANHDPASEAWLREMFAAFYDDEPRLNVNNSADTYYCVPHGRTVLFYHHGHRRKINNVDTVFAGKFREEFGRSKFAYGHIGHLHSDEVVTTNLMQVERHETLASPDAYAAKGGWLSGRSAKVISYHEDYGEVYRSRLRPEMVEGAANDNEPRAMRDAA